MVVYTYNLQLCSLIGTVSQVSYVTNGPLVFMLTYQRIITMTFLTDSSLFKLKEWHCFTRENNGSEKTMTSFKKQSKDLLNN